MNAWEEADWNLQLRFQAISKKQNCRKCDLIQSNMCPFSAPCGTLCHSCYKEIFGPFPWTHFTPKAIRNQLAEDPSLHSRDGDDDLPVTGDLLERFSLMLNADLETPIRLCPMCGLGPSCVEHWLLLCPSTALALSEVKNEFWEFERLLPCPHDKLLQTLKALAGSRRYLLALGELGKVSANSTVSLLRQALQSLNSEECTARVLFHKN
jgi:hypothetical protein